MTKGKTLSKLIGVGVLAALAVVPWAARGDEELTIDQVPEAARAALLKLAGGAKIVEVERENEHGLGVYEAEWVVNGREHEAAVMADGTLVEMAEVVGLETLPPAVRAAVTKHFPGETKLEIEKKTIVAYEVEARVDGKEREVLILPTGKVHGQRTEGSQHHDDADDDD